MKEKFIKSTIILIIGGFITKILGMLIRIVTTRIVGVQGIGLYMLVMPTYGLFITICTLSLPIAISKLVSENTRNNKNVVLGIIPIALLFNVVVITVLILLSRVISDGLLKNELLYYPILASSVTLPFITLSSIIRGYFFGKERMVPHVVSNLFEQIVRLGMTIFITPYLMRIGIISAVCGLILFNVVSELLSILILFLFIPRNVKITKDDIKPDPHNVRDIFSISVPTTFGRIINSVGGFLEPVIITFVFLALGYGNSYITNEYGIITGFVFPMVMLPQFLSGAIASALLPTISKYNERGMGLAIRRKLYQAIFVSLIIGAFFTVIFMLFPSESLKIMFGSCDGYKYLIFAAPIFLLTYIQGPIVSTLQAMDKAKVVMKSSLIGIIFKTLILYFALYLDIGMYALLISIGFQYIFITIYQYIKLKKFLA